VSEIKEVEMEPEGPAQNSTRRYIFIAALLLAVIVIFAILLVTWGIPALTAEDPTATPIPTSTTVPTFTPGPTPEPTHTPPPSPVATLSAPVMADIDNPIYEFEGAGARPSVEWTGFFGQVLDAEGNPLAGVPVIVWYRDGQPASSPTLTDENGYYEIQLAESEAPLAGIWTIQVLTDDGQPASKLFTFQTDEDTQRGIQQIQVNWSKVP
jgi:hypothetical protein